MSDPGTAEAGLKQPQTIFDAIKASISNAHNTGTIANRVVDAFAERENARRVKLLTDAFDKLTALQKALDDINKPDDKKYESAAQDAQPVTFYSEKRRGEIAKATKNLKELTDATTRALTTADYDGLEKALKKGGGGDQKGGGNKDGDGE